MNYRNFMITDFENPDKIFFNLFITPNALHSINHGIFESILLEQNETKLTSEETKIVLKNTENKKSMGNLLNLTRRIIFFPFKATLYLSIRLPLKIVRVIIRQIKKGITGIATFIRKRSYLEAVLAGMLIVGSYSGNLMFQKNQQFQVNQQTQIETLQNQVESLQTKNIKIKSRSKQEKIVLGTSIGIRELQNYVSKKRTPSDELFLTRQQLNFQQELNNKQKQEIKTYRAKNRELIAENQELVNDNQDLVKDNFDLNTSTQTNRISSQMRISQLQRVRENEFKSYKNSIRELEGQIEEIESSMNTPNSIENSKILRIRDSQNPDNPDDPDPDDPGNPGNPGNKAKDEELVRLKSESTEIQNTESIDPANINQYID